MNQAETIKSVQKIQVYIEEHINERITLKQLADSAGYSPWHAERIFRSVAGEVWQHIENFKPEIYGYKWAPESAPKFQLAPMGYRGYIEARPVESLN